MRSCRLSRSGAEIGIDHGLVGADLVGRALGQQAAVAEDADRGRDLEDDVHVVLDEDDGDLLALPEFAHLLDHAPALLRPHARRRLVEQQDLRLQHQRERDVEQLLVAMRQVRQDAFKDLKRKKDAKEISETDVTRIEKDFDHNLMTEYQGKIDSAFRAKEQEVMTV